MSKKSKMGDNGGVKEYVDRIYLNSTKFFDFVIGDNPTEGIPEEYLSNVYTGKKDDKKLIECNHCYELKDWSHYNWVLKGNSRTGKKTLNSRTCKECGSKEAKILKEIKRLNPAPPEGTFCAIEGCENTDLHCDHNHKSKTYRGYICTQHNTGLGKLGDDMMGLVNCFKYLIDTSDDEKTIRKVKKELSKLI